MKHATSPRNTSNLISSRGIPLFSRQFINQILDLCKKAYNSKKRGMEQAQNTQLLLLSSYFKGILYKKEKCLWFFSSKNDNVCKRNKESSVLEGMASEAPGLCTLYWHTAFPPAKGMFKYKQEQDQKGSPDVTAARRPQIPVVSLPTEWQRGCHHPLQQSPPALNKSTLCGGWCFHS